MDFITALYRQTQDSKNASLTTVLDNSYGNAEKAGKSINTAKNTLPKISEINKQQKNIQEAYNTALKGFMGSKWR